MNHPGDHIDEAIDRVLGDLRDAESPDGMQARILFRLESRSPSARTTTRTAATNGWSNWLFTSSARIAGAFAVASALAVALFLHSTRHPEATPVWTPQVAAPIASVSPKPLGLSVQRAPSAQRAADSSPEPSLRADALAFPQQPEPISGEDALAISEMLAPSKPAPPLPLTHQEKLLAQVVRKGDPDQLADLKPEVRAKQVEIARAEFHDFFEPPPVKNSE